MNVHAILPGKLQLSREVEGLLNNGMEFLRKAQEEFATSPTHSIVSFWTAVEILLKVPLAHEHWSLVCSGKRIVRKKYMSGDFQSISFQEACERLSDVLEKPLPQDTLKAFDKIRQHRNRVVHFYHDGYSDEAKAKLLAEQADAWFALNRLMREDWKPLFEGALGGYLAIQETDLLIKNQYYSDIKYSQIKPVLDAHLSNGVELFDCSECEKKAALVTVVSEVNNITVRYLACLVCSSSSVKSAEVKCPECGEINYVSDWPGMDFKCTECDLAIKRYDLFDTSSTSKPDIAGLGTPAGCCVCDARDTVCEFGDNYICSACLTVHDDIHQCFHCGYHSTDVPEYSYSTGCKFCEGAPPPPVYEDCEENK